MKKNIFYSPFVIGFISFFTAMVISGPKFGIYNYLPSYHLFKLPNDISSGNIIYEFFRWNLWFVIFILYAEILKFFNKKIEFDIIKDLKKAFKKKNNSRYLIFLPLIVLPLGILLCDYINLSINFVNPKNGTVFPVSQGTIFLIWIIAIFFERLKK